MAFALISSVIKGAIDPSDLTSTAISTTGANLIVIACSHLNGTTPSFTDSQANTISFIRQQVDEVGTSAISLFYCYAPSVSGAHTFTVDGTSLYKAFVVFAFSGAAASPLDQENSGTTGTGTAVQPGSVTPTEDGELCFAAMSYRDGGTVSIDSGFSTPLQVGRTDDYIGVAAGYLIQTTAAAVNPTFSFLSHVYRGAAIATFKAAPGGGSAAGAAAHYYRQMA